MKIHIIGGPASGKTWLAQFIASQFDIPAFDLDEIFWDRNADRYGIRTLPKKRSESLKRKKNHSLICGGYLNGTTDTTKII